MPDTVEWPDHAGADFHTVLSAIHSILQPQSYLEIGTCTGASLAQAKCASVAIDPQFSLNCDVIGGKPACHLYQLTSDAFFKSHDPISIVGGPIELAFLDGMHYFEYLMRDFVNVERSCRKNSVIFIHDCLPTDVHVARRQVEDQTLADQSRNPGWWAGDLWKFIVLLKEARPDLVVRAYDAPPTGLIAVTNLDPLNTHLRDHYFNLVEAGHSMQFSADVLVEYLQSMNIQPTRNLTNYESVSGQFWL